MVGQERQSSPVRRQRRRTVSLADLAAQLWLTNANTSRAASGNPALAVYAPHFEKMLYDNAQLARVYRHAWQVTGNELLRPTAGEILDYVIRELTDPAKP